MLLRFAVLAVVPLVATLVASGPADAAPGGYTLVWADEFGGGTNSAPNPANWGYDVGGGGWGNGEAQTYTNSRDNSRLDGRGFLVVEARRGARGAITSARLTTLGKRDFTYGYLEARIRMASGQGMHPAFWLLGTNIYTVGWPACGEIDVVESLNVGRVFNSGVHGPNQVGGVSFGHWTRSVGGDTRGIDLSADFHTYAVERTPGRIRTYFDGYPIFDVSRSQLAWNEGWVFDAPAYILLNLAVGGVWPGPVDGSTIFPAAIYVDWIRLYR